MAVPAPTLSRPLEPLLLEGPLMLTDVEHDTGSLLSMWSEDSSVPISGFRQVSVLWTHFVSISANKSKIHLHAFLLAASPYYVCFSLSVPKLHELPWPETRTCLKSHWPWLRSSLRMLTACNLEQVIIISSLPRL